jgi:hypothetical protein
VSARYRAGNGPGKYTLYNWFGFVGAVQDPVLAISVLRANGKIAAINNLGTMLCAALLFRRALLSFNSKHLTVLASARETARQHYPPPPARR